MPITLVTGLPGHGKTLYTIDRWRREAEKAGRPVFHNDIPGLNIPGWQVFDVKDWQQLPAGALAIVDEAWEDFPVTGRGQTPDWVQQLAKHRHLGLDFIVIVQQPMLLDSFVRRLIDRHFHVVRRFGTKVATIYENPTGVVEDVQKPGSRKDMLRSDYRYNAEVYGLYRSAELHTVKARLPMRFWLMCAMPLVFLALCVLAYFKMRPAAQEERIADQLGVSPAASAVHTSAAVDAAPAAGGRGGMTPAEYVAAHTPRIEGLAHTAPIYDGVTQPQQAPYPAACIASAKRCQCYSQQGTRLDMRDALCRTLADGGFFVAWNAAGERVQPGQQPAPATAPAAPQQLAAAGFHVSPPQFAPAEIDPDAGSLPRRVRRAVQ